MTDLLRGAAALPLGFALGCSPALVDSPGVTAPSVVAGTYDVSICDGPCAPDFTNRMVTGFLVLTDAPFTLDAMSDVARGHLQRHEEWLLISLKEFEREPNACFALERRPGAATIAGASPAAITDWRPTDDGIAVLLWISPDAGYEAQLQREGARWNGKAYAWDMSARYHATSQMVTTARTGPPDLDRCFSAIEAEAARRATRDP